jgi:hypothetical protein
LDLGDELRSIYILCIYIYICSYVFFPFSRVIDLCIEDRKCGEFRVGVPSSCQSSLAKHTLFHVRSDPNVKENRWKGAGFEIL